MTGSSIKLTMDLKPLKRLAKKSPAIFSKAMAKGGIQFLAWANNGSPLEPSKPPIRWGVLRGSASAFVGSKMVTMIQENGGTPLTSYSETPTTISWIWNTNYAARMHEHTGNWGDATANDPGAGNKWLEKHLNADKEALMKMIEAEFWKEAKGVQ